LGASCAYTLIDAATDFRKGPWRFKTANPELAGQPTYPIWIALSARKSFVHFAAFRAARRNK